MLRKTLIPIALLFAALAPAHAGGLEDAFKRFIDRLKAEGRKLPDAARAVSQARQIRTPTLAPRTDGLPVGANDIVVFVTPACRRCDQAVAYLKSKGLSHEVMDITTSETARDSYALVGAQGVPTLLLHQQKMNGFSEALLRQATIVDLERKAQEMQGQGG